MKVNIGGRVKLALANSVSLLSPPTRGFALRRFLFSWAGVSLGVGAKVCGTTTMQDPNVIIGPDTWLGSEGCLISGPRASISIGSRCDVGPGVLLVVGTHALGDGTRRAGPGSSAPISIGDGTWLGARVTMVAGSAVGRGCMVAAGAVVTEQFGDDLLIGGVPARVIRSLSESDVRGVSRGAP